MRRVLLPLFPFPFHFPSHSLLLLAAAAGCLQIETRVMVHEDGSATVTERVRFSRRLLDLAGERQEELLALLGKEAAGERAKRMGKGVSLVRHELRDAEKASKESLAELSVPDISDLEYVSPWPHLLDYAENNAIAFKLVPLLTCGSSTGEAWAGQVRVEVRAAKPARRRDDKEPAKTYAPSDQQVFRELGPVFREMLGDFKIRLTFETYGPLIPSHGSPGIRNVRAATTWVDLINFSSDNLDSWGGAFLDNEEVMLELLRGDLAGENVAKHVADYVQNETLPVLMARGSGGTRIFFQPSRQLFDRHFKGKMLDYRPWTKDPPVPAEFEKIGWRGAERTRIEASREKK
ncbi:MAG: hypothetical protein FJ291_05845 [Planctomycetes bacterium]|nr:hypothetical protein [Planctomycetota bacterium]